MWGAECGCVNTELNLFLFACTGNNLNLGVLGLSLLLKLRKASKTQLLLNGFSVVSGFFFFKYLFSCAGS